MPFSAQAYLLKAAAVLLLGHALMINNCLAEEPDSEARSGREYRTIDWIELMPEDDLEALMNPPDYLGDIVDGSAADQIDGQLQSSDDVTGDSRYDQALVSTRIVPELDGQAVRIPGFVVPLEFDEERRVTRFFLVPFFGACIHVPPPPPNQIVYAQYEKGLQLPSLYQPFWISGVLSTSLTENATATAAYVIKVERLEQYTE